MALHALAPAHRGGDLADQQIADLRRVGDLGGRDVGDQSARQAARAGVCCERLGHRVGGRRHQGAMERRGDRQQHGAADALGLGDLDRALDRRAMAGDDHLAAAVVVGRLDDLFAGPSGRSGRRASAQISSASAMSAPSSAAIAPSPAGTAFCIACPRSFSSRAASATVNAPDRAQRAVFAQRMAGGDDRRGDLMSKPPSASSTRSTASDMRHQRRLGVLGEGQFLAGALEHQLRQLLFQGLVHLLEHLARGSESGGEIAAHADGLAALAGEDEGVDRHGIAAPVQRGQRRCDARLGNDTWGRRQVGRRQLGR